MEIKVSVLWLTSLLCTCLAHFRMSSSKLYSSC